MSRAAMRVIGFILGVFLITLSVSMAIPMISLLIYEHSDDLPALDAGILVLNASYASEIERCV